MRRVGTTAYVFMVASLLALLLPLAAFAAAPPDQDAIGEVIYLTGMVRATQPDGTPRELDLASPVFIRDVLSTSLKSSVEIRFKDETVFSQGPESSISLNEFVYSTDASASKLFFKMGTGIFRIVTGEIVKQNPEAFNLETPMATVGIRGTALGLINRKKNENILVLGMNPKHIVEILSRIKNRGKEARSKTLRMEGIFSIVSLDGTISEPAPIPQSMRAKIMTAAPMTSQGELGAAGDKEDLKRKVKAFQQHLAHEKGGLGDLGDKPDYKKLHNITVQQSGQENAENERDGNAADTASQMSGGGDGSGSSGGDGGGGGGQGY